jgi:hypothetical protein
MGLALCGGSAVGSFGRCLSFLSYSSILVYRSYPIKPFALLLASDEPDAAVSFYIFGFVLGFSD